MNVIDIIVSIVIHLFFRIVEPLKIGKEENLHVFNYTFPRNKITLFNYVFREWRMATTPSFTEISWLIFVNTKPIIRYI